MKTNTTWGEDILWALGGVLLIFSIGFLWGFIQGIFGISPNDIVSIIYTVAVIVGLGSFRPRAAIILSVLNLNIIMIILTSINYYQIKKNS